MAKIDFIRHLALMVLQALLFCSCVKAPVELSFKNRIEMGEEDLKKIADNIYEKLAEFDFSHPAGTATAGMIDPQECSKAYQAWLAQKFKEGYLPRGTILAEEFAKPFSSDPKITECRSINFDEEYNKAVDKSAEENKREGMIFSFSEYRKKLEEHKCGARFIDLDREKIEITNIFVDVLENTLTVRPPRYRLYSSFDELAEEDIEEKDSEERLTKNGVLGLLGETKQISRHQTGQMPADLNPNKEKFREAESPIVSLDGVLIAFPTPMGKNPEVTTHRNRQYYLVPRGKISLTLSVNVIVRLTRDDALCAFQKLKESIDEEDEEKKKKAKAEERE